MFRGLKSAVIPILLSAVIANGADLLKDDFTDPSVSRNLWLQDLPAEIMSVTVGGGSCQIANSSEYSGLYTHTFSDPKPSTFTLSFVLKSTSAEGDAGVIFCKQNTEGSLDGYYVTVVQEQVIVYKYSNSEGENIFQERSYDFSPGDNKVTISKDGASFNVFVNDDYVGSFTDENGFSSGDVAFSVSPNATASFGTFLMTDQFTTGELPTFLSDDFEDGELKRWLRLEDKATVEESNGLLNVTTGTDDNLWMYTELNSEIKEAKVEVSHKAGEGTESYGLILIGEGSPVPMVYFGIRGDRRFYVASAEESFSPALNIAINGASDGTDFYVDTLQILKTGDSEAYEFLVNGVSLEEYANIDFQITGVGLFADGGLELEFDNFYAGDQPNTPVVRKARVRKSNIIRNRVNLGTFDLLGRRLSPASVRSFAQPKAAGVYVNERGRKINVRSRKVRD